MIIQEQRQGAVMVVKPQGPVVMRDAEALRQRLLQAVGENLGRVVLDLSAVPFVDSKGLEAMAEVSEQLGRSGQSLRLCAVNKTVREVLEVTDLAQLFDHFDDVTAAVRSFL